MRLFGGLVACAGLIIGWATASEAATLTYKITFSATEFENLLGSAAPVDPVKGSFLLTFDPSKDYIQETNGITATSLNINLGSTLSFTYLFNGQNLTIGGLNASTNGVDGSTDDFVLSTLLLSNASNVFTYTAAGIDDVFFADRTLVSISQTPLPASLPLFLSAIGGLGLVYRRHRRPA